MAVYSMQCDNHACMTVKMYVSIGLAHHRSTCLALILGCTIDYLTVRKMQVLLYNMEAFATQSFLFLISVQFNILLVT